MMEKVISNLMDSPDGLPRKSAACSVRSRITADTPVKALVSAQLPQPKVNKCLIALVGKKIVSKTSIGVSQAASGEIYVADCERVRRSTCGMRGHSVRWPHSSSIDKWTLTAFSGNGISRPSWR
jgi:hypothetical protein